MASFVCRFPVVPIDGFKIQTYKQKMALAVALHNLLCI